MIRRGGIIASLMLLLTFSVGALTGMALEEAMGIDWFEFLDEDNARGDRLLAGLDLSPDQRERVDQIVDDQEDRLEDYWEGRLPEIREILAQSYAEIRAVLSPAQHAAFDRRVQDLEGRVPEEMRD